MRLPARHQNSLDQQKELERFANVISPSLKQEVNQHIYRHIAEKCPLFHKASAIKRELIRKLATVFVRPEVIVAVLREEGSEFYFVASGNCAVAVTDEQKAVHVVKYLSPGDYFGEVALLFDTSRTATVTGIRYCNIAS